MDLKIKSSTSTAVKICGITKVDQAMEIASLGANAIGVIGVKSSKRYLKKNLREGLFNEIKKNAPDVERVWVIANMSDTQIDEGILCNGSPSTIQLHGDESKERCHFLKNKYPNINIWKAIRISSPADLLSVKSYEDIVDALLIDAWNPNKLGGTGERIPIEWIDRKQFKVPLWIAGGISYEWANEIIDKVNPFGIDASSKLEIMPGIKDINKVKSLIQAVRN